jgi:hypothetical protein
MKHIIMFSIVKHIKSREMKTAGHLQTKDQLIVKPINILVNLEIFKC